MVKVFDTVLAFSVVMLLLSLIVTACVQAVSALLDLRGKNLIAAVKLLLEQASEANPALRGYAEEIAQALVAHPAVASGYHHTAKALRSQEVLRLLESLRTGTGLKDEARKALDDALQARVPGLTEEQLTGVKDAAEEVARVLFPNDAAKLEEALKQAAQKAVEQATASTRAFAGRVEGWFDTVMDRSSDRFQKDVRLWTIAFSFVLAFGLQVDSLRLLGQISTDDTVRLALVQNADLSLELGGEVLGPPPAERAATTLAGAHPDQAQALTQALQGARTCMQGQARLERPGAPELTALAAEFATDCQKQAREDLDKVRGQVERAAELLQVDRLRVFAPQPPWTCAFWRGYLAQGGLVFLGTLMTAVFLSLGAPFWYNALRQLANLRPMIAGKVEAKPASGAAGAAASPAAKS